MNLKKYTNIIIILAFALGITFVSINSNTETVFAKKIAEIELSGNEEIPSVITSATGKATFRTAVNDTIIKYKINITGFPDATGAHIHIGKVGENGEPIVDLLKDAKENPTKEGMVIRGNITDTDLMRTMQGKGISDLISLLDSGNTYVNIHTEKNPNGEIRGQLDSESEGTSVQ